MLRLINPDEPIHAEFEGVNFDIQVLTNGQLNTIRGKIREAGGSIDASCEYIAPYISIHGYTAEQTADVLKRIADQSVQLAIITTFFGRNFVSVEEAKNSVSLSDGSQGNEPARE